MSVDIFDPAVPGSQLISAKEIGAILGISPITWLDWSRKGKAPAPYPLMDDSVLRWRVDDLRQHLQTRRENYLKRYKLDEA